MSAPLTAEESRTDPSEPQAFELINPGLASPFLLICDHASNRVPVELQDLGLLPEQLELHIAYDIGAAAMTRELARLLPAPAVLSCTSRLVIDANRVTDHPTSIAEISDGVTVPGNLHLDAAERRRRIACYFEPYHRAITAELEGAVAAGRRPILVSLHSFTAVMEGYQRPWNVGVLWDKDDRMAAPMIAALTARGLTVGDNQPYSGGTDFAFTMRHHALPLDLPQVLLEVRQDLIGEERAAKTWAALLAEELAALARQTA